MSKEILLISNYFPPEKGAAANRLHSMAMGLSKSGYDVEVVCPLPNYPNGKIFTGYKGRFFQSEKTLFGNITRLWIFPSHSSNKLLRLLSMTSFSLSLILFFLFNRIPNKIFIQNSPLVIGFTGVIMGRLFSKKIILNVSDLWPLAGLEMGLLQKGRQYSQLLKMERYCYRKSELIIGQSNEILHHIKSLNTEKPLFLYRNIPNFDIKSPKLKKSEDIKIVYAGLLGIAQSLITIIDNIKLPKNISLHIYGSGPEAEELSKLKKENIFFHNELEREELHSVLKEYDIAFVPLINRIYGSVPSKIFEYSRLGLPILYFAGGEGEEIVNENSLGWVIPVNNYEALQEFITKLSELQLNEFPKNEVQGNSVKAFNFDRQFKQLLKKIEAI